MVFDASSLLPEKGYRRARAEAINIHSLLTAFNATMAAGNVGFDAILERHKSLVDAIAVWNEVKAIPGIAEYAQAQAEDPGYDVVAEFNAMIAAAEDVTDWLSQNAPNGGSPNFFTDGPAIASGGALTWRQYTPAQTAGYRTQISTFLATIS